MARLVRGRLGAAFCRVCGRTVSSNHYGPWMKLIAVILLTAFAFAYGVGVGYCRWPPFNTLKAVAQSMPWRAPDPGKSAYYEARIALFRDVKGMPACSGTA